MSMQEMTAVITRFQVATDALAALGARLGMGESDPVAPEILTAGCLDVHSLTRTWPIPFGFVTGRRA